MRCGVDPRLSGRIITSQQRSYPPRRYRIDRVARRHLLNSEAGERFPHLRCAVRLTQFRQSHREPVEARDLADAVDETPGASPIRVRRRGDGEGERVAARLHLSLSLSAPAGQRGDEGGGGFSLSSPGEERVGVRRGSRRARPPLLPVMAGLVPAIHVSPSRPVDGDARNKSGHDDGGGRAGGGTRPDRTHVSVGSRSRARVSRHSHGLGDSVARTTLCDARVTLIGARDRSGAGVSGTRDAVVRDSLVPRARPCGRRRRARPSSARSR